LREGFLAGFVVSAGVDCVVAVIDVAVDVDTDVATPPLPPTELATPPTLTLKPTPLVTGILLFTTTSSFSPFFFFDFFAFLAAGGATGVTTSWTAGGLIKVAEVGGSGVTTAMAGEGSLIGEIMGPIGGGTCKMIIISHDVQLFYLALSLLAICIG
jgi:hypothetical protein